MAGEWIKMRGDLQDDPTVLGICAETKLDEFAVIGRLHKLWSWADRHTVDGVAHGVSPQWVDHFVSHPGFASAMQQFDWLAFEDGALIFPAFHIHNGKTAKTRAESNRRVAEHRQRNADVTVTPLPGKGREEKSTTTTPPGDAQTADGKPPRIVRLHPHCTQIEAEEWAAKRNGSMADGVRITPEIAVAWWEDRTRLGWVAVKGEATIPLNSPQAVETDLVRYARLWANNALKPKVTTTHANNRPIRPTRSDSANAPGRYAAAPAS